MILLVISDLHLGKGKFFRNGQQNILEDFSEDERLNEFLQYYSSKEYEGEHVHLVLNGDIFNLIQIDHYGVFSKILDEDITVKSLESIASGHPLFFEGLKKFLKNDGNELSFVIGNHDSGMDFPGAQKKFNELVDSEIHFCSELDIHGIHIEHGHRFEAINTVPTQKYYIDGPQGQKILNLPWGSLFCIEVLPQLKKLRPNIDKIRPLPSYVKWCFFHDFAFFLHMSWAVVKFVIKSTIDPYSRQSTNLLKNIRMLQQITIYPKFARMAKRILKRRPHIHTVIMGHTHVPEWRRFPEGKHYFNSGTWNVISSVDAGLLDNMGHLNYVYVEVHEESKSIIEASLSVWQGKWRPFRIEGRTQN